MDKENYSMMLINQPNDLSQFFILMNKMIKE